MGVGGELGTREVFDWAGNQQAKVHLTIDLISRLPFSELKPVHYKVAKQHNSGSSQVGPPEPSQAAAATAPAPPVLPRRPVLLRGSRWEWGERG